MTIDKDCQTNLNQKTTYLIDFRFGKLKGSFELGQIADGTFMLKKYRDYLKIGRLINEQSRYYKNKVKVPFEDEKSRLDIVQTEYERYVDIYSRTLNKINYYNNSLSDLSAKYNLNDFEIFNRERSSSTFSMDKDGLNFSFNEQNDTVEFQDLNVNNSNVNKMLQTNSKSFSCQELGVTTLADNSNFAFNNCDNFKKKNLFEKKTSPVIFENMLDTSLSPSNLSIDEKMQVEKPELDKENKFDDKTSILTTTDDDKRSSQSTGSSFLKRINSNPMLLNVANMNIPKLNAISNNMIRKSFSSKDISFTQKKVGDNMSVRSFRQIS